MDSNIGRKLDGRYELQELIGVGGMADIYKAFDILEEKTVAVKILKNEFAASEDFLRRFRNESKAIAFLSHPNIVKIYDVGFTDKIQFIVMEYIDGITLTEYIEKQGVVKWKDAVHFTIQILRALQHAHDRGIVHRDIKPQNVMLLQDGTIKVMDFGIARFARETGKTVSEKAIGSVHYISPEQAKGELTDERSDIYSVGVMLYEMLTGKKPYDGDTPVAIALKHMQSPCLKPTQINPDIPTGLEEIVIRAMQKDMDKRYQSAAEMIRDIEEFKKDSSIVFEYKYMTNDETTKYFDAVNPDSDGKKKPAKAVKIEDEEEDGEYEDDEEEESRPSPFVPVLAAVAAAFVVIAAIVCVVFFMNGIGGGSGKEITMPDLRGLTLDEAMDQYGNFQYKQVEEPEFSLDYPEGTICIQDPEAGATTKEHKTVTVTISKGPEMLEIEDVTGKTPKNARRVLEEQGYKVTEVYEISAETPKDLVIRTEPEAGTSYASGKEVTVYISSGEISLMGKMPYVVGMTKSKALDAIAGQGIDVNTINVKSEYSDTVDKGTVMKQSPDKDTIIGGDTAISITVSAGVQPIKDVDVSVEIPSGFSGDCDFTAYLDGQKVDTVTISMADAQSWKFKLSSQSESGTLKIKVKGTQGEAVDYAEYDIDFKAGTASVKFQDASVFKSIMKPTDTDETETDTDTATDTDTTSTASSSSR